MRITRWIYWWAVMMVALVFGGLFFVLAAMGGTVVSPPSTTPFTRSVLTNVNATGVRNALGIVVTNGTLITGAAATNLNVLGASNVTALRITGTPTNRSLDINSGALFLDQNNYLYHTNVGLVEYLGGIHATAIQLGPNSAVPSSMTVLYSDGSGSSATGAMSWDTAGNLTANSMTVPGTNTAGFFVGDGSGLTGISGGGNTATNLGPDLTATNFTVAAVTNSLFPLTVMSADVGNGVAAIYGTNNSGGDLNVIMAAAPGRTVNYLFQDFATALALNALAVHYPPGTPDLSLNRIGAGDVVYCKADPPSIGINMSSPTSTLHVSGSFAVAVATVGADYSMGDSDATVFVNANNVNITLPSASGHTGRICTLKLVVADGGADVLPQDGDKIDGTTDYNLTGLNKFVTVQSDGGINWFIIGQN